MAEIQFCGFEGAWHTTVQPCDRVDGINSVFAHSLFPHPAIARINQMTRGNKSKIQNIFHLRRWRSQIMLNMAAFFLLLKPCRQIAKKAMMEKIKAEMGKRRKWTKSHFQNFGKPIFPILASGEYAIQYPTHLCIQPGMDREGEGRENERKKSTFGNSVDFLIADQLSLFVAREGKGREGGIFRRKLACERYRRRGGGLSNQQRGNLKIMISRTRQTVG